jgi:hypothetical protein
MHGEEYSSDRALIDLLLNLNMFMFLIVIVLLVISVITTAKVTEGIPVKAEYIVTMKWQDGLDCDVDMYVKDPTGAIAYFRSLNAGVANIERDDRGNMGDGVEGLDGKYYQDPTNEEKYTIRKIVPGEYIVNAHLYTCHVPMDPQQGANSATRTLQPGDPSEVPVFVTLDKVNPALKTLKKAAFTLHKVWEETTAFRFTIAADGSVSSYDDTPAELVKTQKED